MREWVLQCVQHQCFSTCLCHSWGREVDGTGSGTALNFNVLYSATWNSKPIQCPQQPLFPMVQLHVPLQIHVSALLIRMSHTKLWGASFFRMEWKHLPVTRYTIPSSVDRCWIVTETKTTITRQCNVGHSQQTLRRGKHMMYYTKLYIKRPSFCTYSIEI